MAQGPGIWLFVGDTAVTPKLYILSTPLRWMVSLLLRVL
jgi:hypothetical protein